jgi:hypothetical protein
MLLYLHAPKAVVHQRLMGFLDTTQDQSSMIQCLGSYTTLYLRDAMMQEKREQPLAV